MPHAIVMHEPGDTAVLRYEPVTIPQPTGTQVHVRHRAIGVNFIDTYYRTGLYKWPQTPLTPGAEAAGDVVAVGEAVTHIKPGDRVAYTTPTSAYAQERLIDAKHLIVLPDDIAYETAAAITLKGLTAQYLLRSSFRIEAGHTVLFHAAAGGVGLLAGQWLAHLGATVIGTAGSAEKMALAKENGYAHMINYRTENFVERVMEITEGQGVDVVYDSVGQDTYPASLNCLKKHGTWVCFGQSSGMIKNFALSDLAQRGSLFATRPVLFDFIDTPETLAAAAADLFDVIQNGAVKIAINQEFALAEAGKAHQLLEGRKTTGSTILRP
ncbi:MAG: quinone oxidoreductase [Ardenticatenaceae bacterium]|nr:quinone oxidoreductase [Ardenticatenaceae bacterium]